MSKKVITIFLCIVLLSSISISAFADEYIGDVSSGNLQIYDGSVSSVNSYNPVQPNYINDPLTINEFWDNWYSFMLNSLGAFLETYLPNIASDTRTWLNMWRINGSTEGIYHRLFTRLVDTQSWSGMTNLYSLYSAIVSNNVTSYVDGIEGSLNSINSNVNTAGGALITIRNAINSYLSNMHSDLQGLNRMFSSVNGGGAYYNQLIGSGGALENIETYTQNSAAGIHTLDGDLLDINNAIRGALNYTVPALGSPSSVFYDSHGHFYLNGIDASASDLLNYFYAFFIDDDRPNSMNGGEAIIETAINTSDIFNSLGYSSSSTLATALGDISDSQDTANSTLNSVSGQLDDIIDVLANHQDQTIVNNQTINRNTVIPLFFNGSSSDTSIGNNDFIDLGRVLSKIRQFFNPNVSIGDFSDALDNGLTAGQSFFSQEVYNDLNGVVD